MESKTTRHERVGIRVSVRLRFAGGPSGSSAKCALRAQMNGKELGLHACAAQRSFQEYGLSYGTAKQASTDVDYRIVYLHVLPVIFVDCMLNFGSIMKRFLSTSLVCGQLGVLGRSNSQRDSLVVDSSAGIASDIVSCACPPLPPPLPLQPSAQLG